MVKVRTLFKNYSKYIYRESKKPNTKYILLLSHRDILWVVIGKGKPKELNKQNIILLLCAMIEKPNIIVNN